MVAGWFVTLIRKYPTLETSAFIVIGLLGIKLLVTGFAAWFGWISVNEILSHHSTDIAFSMVLMTVFFIPLIFAREKNKDLRTLGEEDPERDIFHH